MDLTFFPFFYVVLVLLPFFIILLEVYEILNFWGNLPSFSGVLLIFYVTWLTFIFMLYSFVPCIDYSTIFPLNIMIYKHDLFCFSGLNY